MPKYGMIKRSINDQLSLAIPMATAGCLTLLKILEIY